MRLIELIPAQYRLAVLAVVVLALVAVGAVAAWEVQGWRYEQRLAEQRAQVAEDAQARAWATVGMLQDAGAERSALEGRLKINDDTHHLELTHVQKTTQALRDRLATADLRLSVSLAPGSGGGGQQLSAAASPGGVVHGGARAELDPAHAQRIVTITGDGDEGLTALQACQGYVHEIYTASLRMQKVAPAVDVDP